MPADLIKFLIEEKAFEKYVQNTKKYLEEYPRVRPFSYSNNLFYILDVSFRWDETPEGYNYWYRIYCKLKNY